MGRMRVRTKLRGLAASVVLSMLHGVALAQGLSGQPIVEVLKSLQGRGVQFLYSSSLLTRSMIVQSNPTGTAPEEIAREILAPYGLELALVQPGRYAVVRTRAPDPAPESRAAVLPLAEIVVSTSRYASEDLFSSAVVLDGVELASQPGLGDDSIRSLGRLPGMAQNGAGAQSNVRGGEASEVLTLLDGFPIRQAFHLPAYQSLFSILDPGVIASAEVFTGGFPVRYGNRMSGVFDLTTVQPDEVRRRSLGLSFFNATAFESGRLDRFPLDYTAAARVGTLKPLLKAFFPGTGEPSYSDVFTRVGFGDRDSLRVTANLLWARDELAISSRSRGEEADIESRSRYLWLRADRDWTPSLESSLWIGHSQIDSVRSGTVENPGLVIASVDDSRASEFWDLRGRVAWQASDRQWLEGGFEWTDESAKYYYLADAEYPAAVAGLFDRQEQLSRDIVLGPARQRVAAFSAYRWRLTRALTAELGLRVQRQLTKGAPLDWTEDPRIGVRWEISPRTTLRAHWGRFHQADEIQELAVDDGLVAFAGPQRTDQLILGLEHRFENTMALRIESFLKHQSSPRARFENVLNSLYILPEVAPDRIALAPQFAEIGGIELSLRQGDPQRTRWASLTLSQVRDEIRNRDVPRSWDQTWAVSAGADWHRGAWQFGAAANVHRGWPTTVLIDAGADHPTLGDRNAERLPLFASVDLRAQYQHSAWRGLVTYAFEISNVLNRSNACCAELSVVTSPSGERTFQTRELSWLPLVPSFSVKWEQ